MGDFNFLGVQWDSTISETNGHLSCLVGLRDFLYLDQMITEPTRKSNTLNVLFCNESIIESIVIDETVISDHNIIHVNSYLRIIDKSDPKVMNPAESVFEQINFFKADWDTIVQEIITSNLSNSIQHLHTEDALNLFVKTYADRCRIHTTHVHQTITLYRFYTFHRILSHPKICTAAGIYNNTHLDKESTLLLDI